MMPKLGSENVILLPEDNLEDGINWVTRGAVTPVKN